MIVLSGGSLCPDGSLIPLTICFALMRITSKAATNRIEETTHSDSHQVLEGKTHVQVVEVRSNDIDRGGRAEELHGVTDQLVWDRTVSIFRIKPDDVQICLFPLSLLNLVPDHGRVLHTPWEPWNSHLQTPWCLCRHSRAER